MPETLRRLLPGLWAGVLLALAALATPSAFALYAPADAGRFAGRVLMQEAYLSLVLATVLLVLERRAARMASTSGHSHFSVGMALTAVALFCTVAGHFALQPMLDSARAGQGPFSFGQLHAASVAFYGIKTLAVLVLAWRAAGATRRPSS